MSAGAARTMVVWCPDWPVIAAEIVDDVSAREPVAILYDNRVVVSSPAARAVGVLRGTRKRDAQARCPQLTVLDYDAGRDARAFEPVIAAIEEMAAGVAVLRPGVVALPARGPASYYGSEELAGERIVEHVAAECGVEAQVGIAEGTFAALLAARAGKHVPAGGTPAFLAGLPISTLDRPELAGLLERLGIRTLGAFAALRPADVAARFGLDATLAHRLAAGRDDRPLAIRTPPPDLDVEERFEEPIERVDVAAFAGRAMGDRLHAKLAGHGLACTRLLIGAVTVDGLELHREWRHEGVLTAAGIADRVHWQLDGWLTRHRRTGRAGVGGIVLLRLSPQGVLGQLGTQPGLWGEPGEERDRAHRAMHRVQGLLGPGAVQRAILGGGNDPAGRVTLVPWGEEYVPELQDGPWPDRLPAPSPAVVFDEPRPAVVLDAAGRPVTVSPRLELSAPPAQVVLDGAAGAAKQPERTTQPGRAEQAERTTHPGRPVRAGSSTRAGAPAQAGVPVEVLEWVGPWPADEHWWDRQRAAARLRFQARLADGRLVLLAVTAGTWSWLADYD